MMKIPPYPWTFKSEKTNIEKPLHNKKWILVDLLGNVLASQWKQNAICTIENAAYVCSHQKEWNDIRDVYSLLLNPYKMLPRFKNHNDEKHHLIIWFKCLLSKKISMSVFVDGLYSFKCIRAYVLELQWYRYATVWLYIKLFDGDSELKKLIEDYNSDWDAFRIATNVLKCIFGVESVEVPPDYEKLNLDGYIYSRSNRFK